MSAAASKPRVPAVEGWFRMDPGGPHLLGSRCRLCRTPFFPPETAYCRNPGCGGTEFDEVALSRRGRLWSYTDNRYPPPAPYVAADPFEPYAIAAVELEAERMVVLGQVARGIGVERLRTGMEMELVLETLFEDAEREVVVWKWKPVADEGPARGEAHGA